MHSSSTHRYTGIVAVWSFTDQMWIEWDSFYPLDPTHWWDFGDGKTMPEPPQDEVTK